MRYYIEIKKSSSPDNASNPMMNNNDVVATKKKVPRKRNKPLRYNSIPTCAPISSSSSDLSSYFDDSLLDFQMPTSSSSSSSSFSNANSPLTTTTYNEKVPRIKNESNLFSAFSQIHPKKRNTFQKKIITLSKKKYISKKLISTLAPKSSSSSVSSSTSGKQRNFISKLAPISFSSSSLASINKKVSRKINSIDSIAPLAVPISSSSPSAKCPLTTNNPLTTNKKYLRKPYINSMISISPLPERKCKIAHLLNINSSASPGVSDSSSLAKTSEKSSYNKTIDSVVNNVQSLNVRSPKSNSPIMKSMVFFLQKYNKNGSINKSR